LTSGKRIILDGSWEKKQRNITAAAFTGLIGIGAIYFNLQSYLTLMFISVYNIFAEIELSGDFHEILEIIFGELKIPVLAALVISQFGFMLLPSLWITKKWHTVEVKKYIRMKSVPVTEVILVIFITISMLPLCYMLSELVADLFKIPEIFRTMGDELFSADTLSEYVLLVFVVAVTPAICEEVFFRGYVQRTMERTLGTKSFIVTGIVFSLFHMQPLGLLVLSILGLIFSFFYYRSKSLYPPMAAHFINNFIAITLIYAGVESNDLEAGFGAFTIITSFLIGAALFIIYMRITKGRSDAEPLLERIEEPVAEYPAVSETVITGITDEG
jgi:membrane protease YdiL (CAAX protease family)